MVENPNIPHKIPPKQVQPIQEEGKEKEEPTKKFLTMDMTKKEYQQFLNNYVKMMLSLIKGGEKRMISAMKKISDPDHPG